MISHAPKIAGYVAAALLVLFPLIYSAGNYDFVMHLWITAFYYAILASSWAFWRAMVVSSRSPISPLWHWGLMARGFWTTMSF